MTRLAFSALALLLLALPRPASAQAEIGGIYPHLAVFNDENECGTGAVVPWADRLWVITYAPHMPKGSSDKLHEITTDLELRVFSGSVGGTPANRMIHRETDQLLIGPYLIDSERTIRTITPAQMPGRLTGNARHLTDPEGQVYYATMEEGLYAVDLETLEVTTHILDGHANKNAPGVHSQLPGYHGKGLYSGQGRVVYANNGDRGPLVNSDPTVPSGALAEWSTHGEDWGLVRRNQFTEITGPGGIEGSSNPGTDPIWSMGWDARSVLLALLEDGTWSYYRLPKGSHSYDGAHGWNTEWPRIREIGEGKDLLATMHGTFWRFPATFSRGNSAGIAPRSNYLKVIGDFCRWGDRVVLGCDDSAKAEFLNTRPFKARHAGPLQSNSNLWFVKPERLDDLGPLIGRGSVWLRDDVKANTPSDPYLFSGYDHLQLHLVHGSEEPVAFTLEIDREGTGAWETLRTLSLDPGTSASPIFPADEAGTWIRIRADRDCTGVTANFQFRNLDARTAEDASLFSAVAKTPKRAATRGLMRSLAHDRLGFLALDGAGNQIGYYEMGPDMELSPKDDPKAAAQVLQGAQPTNRYSVDAASILVIEDGKRYRLPKSTSVGGQPRLGDSGKTLAAHLAASLSREAKVSVSGTHGGYEARFATDGKTGDDSRWIAGGDGSKWIELDLGEPREIHSLAVLTGWKGEAQYAAKDFDLQRKVDGEWKTLPGGTIRGNNQIERLVNLKAPVTAQHLRLVSADEGYLRVYEFAAFDKALEITNPTLLTPRLCREVATERDLLNLGGTVYELPARNAFGVAKIRPVATHGLAIHDFCSHAGMLLLTGIEGEGERIYSSEDGKAQVWAGVIDELWQLGKPRGEGGPWRDTEVKAGQPSDPYLMTAYEEKEVELSSTSGTTINLEIDVDGTGLWIPYKSFDLQSDEPLSHRFPKGFSAYWVRATSSADTTASVVFTYR